MCLYEKDNLSLVTMTNSGTYHPSKQTICSYSQGLDKGKVDTLGNASGRLNRRLGRKIKNCLIHAVGLVQHITHVQDRRKFSSFSTS